MELTLEQKKIIVAKIKMHLKTHSSCNVAWATDVCFPGAGPSGRQLSTAATNIEIAATITKNPFYKKEYRLPDTWQIEKTRRPLWTIVIQILIVLLTVILTWLFSRDTVPRASELDFLLLKVQVERDQQQRKTLSDSVKKLYRVKLDTIK